MSSSGINPSDYKRALGNFATGITVVTTGTQSGKPEGLTVNSFNSLSLDPPLILWSLDKSAPTVTHFQDCAYFAINVLSADQVSLSQNFAKPRQDKFEGIKWKKGLGGSPVFPDCLAQIECSNHAQHDGGDHILFIGKVENVHVNANAGEPLIYVQGKYGVLSTLSDA